MSKLRKKTDEDYKKKKKLFWEDKEKAPGTFERLKQYMNIGKKKKSDKKKK